MSDSDDDSKKSRFDSVLPDIFKRAVERGKERAQEAPENLRSFVGDKIPKEVSSYVFHQVDETKNGLLKVFAGEVRNFLEATNLSSELRKLLTTVKFEIHTTIRFSPNDEKPKAKGKGADDSGPRDGETSESKDGEPTSSDRESDAPPSDPSSTPDEDEGGLHIDLRSGELPKIRRR